MAGFNMPKIPDSKEIAGLVAEAMAPMAKDIEAIRLHLGELVALTKIDLGIERSEPVYTKEGCPDS